ncbi:HTH domain-containing protein [Patescibacteria group bacterium]|nr:HTH domain-containing protein [Patescibacteria group bacterium]
MNTKEKIKNYLKTKGKTTGKELADFLNITDRAVRKQLVNLLDEKMIIKIGRPPKVFYSLRKLSDQKEQIKINPKIRKIINDSYLLITPEGKKLEGIEGFAYWCKKQNLPIEKTAEEYIRTVKKYSAYKKNGLIDGTKKMKKTFNKIYLDNTLYIDFYSIERFGKTKLGQLLLYAKQSQNKRLIREIVKTISPIIKKIEKKYKIDGVGFVPPTVKREVQFMNELKKALNLKIKEIKITKIKTEISVPQKTLSKLSDRVENAKQTFAIEERGKFNSILLIDDAVGSGATLNEIAKIIKDKGLTKKITGLSMVGSFKGFDVISEV